MKSWIGVCAGLTMTAIIIYYAQLKLVVLLNYQDITILEPIMRNYFNDTFSFGSKQGFGLAFGITGYDSSSDGSSGRAYG